MTRTTVLVTAVLSCVLSGCVFYLNPLCTDQIKNGEETGIDCGGTCGKCDVGQGCKNDDDCDNSTCEGGTCTALPCDNGVRDEQETDVDCGGGTCRKCAGARRCSVGTDCFSGNCVTSTNRCFSLEMSFADAVPYASGDKTYAIFAGDLDGDLDIDLAAANEQESSISVFLNSGTGIFTKLATPFPTGEYPTGGAIADMNNDGIADVVTADYHGDSVSVLLGQGGGTLQGRSTYPTVADSETSNLAVGDLDGDGILDVVATNPLSGSVSQFLGRADGTLQDAIDLPVGLASTPYSAAIGDFDGNGTADLAVADVRSGQLFVRLGNGDGTFQPEVGYTEGGTPPYILITRDLDLDGILDLVCANRASNDVSVLVGRGDGTFRPARVSSTGQGTGPYSLAVADFNLDGVPDVVTANFESSTASVLLGIGNGFFDEPFGAGTTGEATYGVAAGLFDGDTKPDFATANANTNNITVKINTSR